MSISAIILTYNESIHIERCIKSLSGIVDTIFIVDSHSNDNTVELFSSFDNVSYVKKDFVNYSEQFNFALDYFDIKTDWVIRIDADEYIDNDLKYWISENIHTLPETITGVHVNRYMKFLGKLMKHGGMNEYWVLRMWRNNVGRCEQRWMDEHIVLEYGDTIKSSGKLIDDNMNNLSWWSHKHVNYSTREAIDILLQEEKCSSSNQIKSNFFGSSAERIRSLKGIYNKLPLFTRPFLYFIYRYFVRFGFMDGKEGFLWCILQGFWYRTLVDAKYYEIHKYARLQNITVKEFIKKTYGYEI
jgi:glycosyltransferase involved in cell wall biosynthesis